MNESDAVLQQVIQWAEERDEVRAALLTSTRANPDAPRDALSDYDVVLVVDDIRPFHADRSWIADFGTVLAGYWDPIYPAPGYGFAIFGNVIEFLDSPKIDFNLWPVELLRQLVRDQTLIADLDDGYRVLLDKDGLAGQLPPPTYTVFVPKPPEERKFHAVVESFYNTAPYVAKNLLRDELMPAKWALDYDMKHNFLRPMLEWRVEIDHDWSIKIGVLGKGLKTHLPPAIWSRLERTYTGAALDDNWDALLTTLDLFRDVAKDVAADLDYRFPDEMHEGVVKRLQEMRQLVSAGEQRSPAP